MARVRWLGPGGAHPLAGRWELAAVEPDTVTAPTDPHLSTLDWMPCPGPMPAAAALRGLGRWDLAHPRDFDADDWWYRCRFAAAISGRPARLRIGGLATVADVWLNGNHLLHSENMFVEHVVDVGRFLRAGDNELMIRVQALAPRLGVRRRPRARWRSALVADNALRWHRTSLLGRMPAWCPGVAPVGPWRPVTIEQGPLRIESAHLRTSLDGDTGVIHLDLIVSGATRVNRAVASVAGEPCPLRIEDRPEQRYALSATARVPGCDRWWPHTHGQPALYPAQVSIDADGSSDTIDLGRIGFRTISIDRGADGLGFGLIVNGVPLFCRGVCWTPLDLARLGADANAYRAALEQLRDAGVNMVRVPGVTVYEPEAFHDLCDELGLLLWQDLMFASMDYPWEDEQFASAATAETTQVLSALEGRPSLAVICGSSEIDQQSAMLGLPEPQPGGAALDARLRPLVERFAPETAWLPTTPTGGTFPFQCDVGVSHYFGVGAYRRPLDDARRSGVRFAAECLAFANLPENSSLSRLLKAGIIPGSHPLWKARVPRDAGAAWDFDDVRDYYVEQLFGVGSSAVRERDLDRYVSLGRVATGEAMLRAVAEWRRPGSRCRGALVWFARDLASGPGWGVIDSTGAPKSTYWYLKRAFAPIALFSADEGLNGLRLHALNDTSEAVDAELTVTCYRGGVAVGREARVTLKIPARGARTVSASELFGAFVDITDAYRFGSLAQDCVASTLRDRRTGRVLASDCYCPGRLPSTAIDVGLRAHAEPTATGYTLRLECQRFAHAVAIDVDGYSPDDNYFHLEPGEPLSVTLTAAAGNSDLQGRVSALNALRAVPIVVVKERMHAG